MKSARTRDTLKVLSGFFIVAAGLVLGGCGSAAIDTPVAARALAVDSAAPVRLLYTRAYNYGCSSCASWTGVIEVADLAYDKQVTVLWRREDSPSFIETEARYLRKLPSGRELWSFDDVGAIGTTELAVRYRARGNDYWDSRDGRNYIARADFLDGWGLVGIEQPLGDELEVAVHEVAVSPAARGHATSTLLVEAVVRNRAYDKELTLVSSIDGWATVQNQAGGYRYGEGAGERWGILYDFDPSATRIDFAVSARMAGGEYWDNDFARNYTCRRDPSTLIWRCGGFALLVCSGSAGCSALPAL